MIPALRWLRFRVNCCRSLTEADQLAVELLGLDWSDPEVEEIRAHLDQNRRWIAHRAARAQR
jgi:hypothetical protein